jgi:hypothetical protein
LDLCLSFKCDGGPLNSTTGAQRISTH